MLTLNEVVALVASQPKTLLVAIDGLSPSGNTTLAQQVIKALARSVWGWTIWMRPEVEWSSRDKPSFPSTSSLW